MRRTLLLVLATVLATACVSSDDDSGPGECGGKCDDSSSTTLEFAADGTENLTGRLVAGRTVRIDYDLDRLQLCRGSTGGSEVWGVTGHVRFDDGEVETVALSRLDGGRVIPEIASIEIPAGASHIETWFSISNRWGCIAYDSDYGANYGWDIESGTTGDTVVLDFAADFTFTQTGAVAAGDRVVVHYDPSRLAECSGSTGGHAAWSVTGHWQIDDGPVHDLAVSRADGTSLVAADPMITVGDGRDLALWFDATSIWGCHAWDSAYGANYHVTIN